MSKMTNKVMFKVWLCLGSLCLGLWSGAAAQTLTQSAPVSLSSFALNPSSTDAELSVSVTNTGEKRVVAVALGVVMVDAFNDVIAVHYARWTDDLNTLAPGASATLSTDFFETRADELFLSVPFVYAVRFEDGTIWKENLNHVTTELLSRFEVAASSSVLQPQ